jgi:hypothetical protein
MLIASSFKQPSVSQIRNQLSKSLPLPVASTVASAAVHFTASKQQAVNSQVGSLSVHFVKSFRFSAWLNASASCLFVTVPARA